MVCTCIAVAVCPRSLLAPAFLLLGISVGVPILPSRSSLVAHIPHVARPSSPSSISVGASELSPLPSSPHVFSCITPIRRRTSSLPPLLPSQLRLRARSQGPAEPARAPSDTSSNTAFYLIAVFAFAAFLQVGIENTVAAWLPTYALRTAAAGLVLAAASTSFYWAGFLCSRGLSSLLLLRAEPMRVFRIAVGVAFASALLLEFAPSLSVRNIAMFLLGASLAPTYPLVLAGFFARSRHTADSRWILFTAGFGGSVLPWIAGFISTHTDSLRTGMLTIPAALLLMAILLPTLREPSPKTA